MKKCAIKKVLVPVDFSALSMQALQTAVAICKRQEASLTLMQVIENSCFLLAGVTTYRVLSELVTIANENLEKHTKALQRTHDLTVNHIVQLGNPADEICNLVALKEMDLIVMGSHGSSRLSKLPIGSTAYRVVQYSTCPVLTIPRDNPSIDLYKILLSIRISYGKLDKYKTIRPIVEWDHSNLPITGIVKKNYPKCIIKIAPVNHAQFPVLSIRPKTNIRLYNIQNRPLTSSSRVNLIKAKIKYFENRGNFQ